MSAPPPQRPLPLTVWALGLTSMLTDISSEMILSVLPLFLATQLGASAAVYGALSGLGEVVTHTTKGLSGWFSDQQARRKPMVIAGYTLSLLSRPFFALATTPFALGVAIALDRTGKGTRVAPRDAWLSELTPADDQGRAFGLRQALDTTGAVLGPFIAFLLLFGFDLSLRAIMLLALIPASLAVGAIIFTAKEVPRPRKPTQRPQFWPSVARLPRAYWTIIGLTALIGSARLGEGFLLLRALESGIPSTWVPAVLVGINAAYALLAYPAASWTESYGRKKILTAGLLLLAVAHLAVAAATTPALFAIGALIWGAHMALTQSLLATAVAQHTAPAQRGTAFGIFGAIQGFSLLLAHSLAGAAWAGVGAATTFSILALIAGITAIIVFQRFPADVTPRRA